MHMFSKTSWDERYKAGQEQLPWDSGIPAPELVEYFDNLDAPPERVLEIGCGTGTNAIWMAEQGCRVIATELSPTAVEAAKAKCEKAGCSKVDLIVSDITEKEPVAMGSVDFVFDRGVFHVMPPEDRKLFVERVAAALDEGGYWLSLAGNSDEKRPEGVEGPPQLKASDLVNTVEELFEIHFLNRASFVLPDGKPHLAWKALYRKRGR